MSSDDAFDLFAEFEKEVGSIAEKIHVPPTTESTGPAAIESKPCTSSSTETATRSNILLPKSAGPLRPASLIPRPHATRPMAGPMRPSLISSATLTASKATSTTTLSSTSSAHAPSSASTSHVSVGPPSRSHTVGVVGGAATSGGVRPDQPRIPGVMAAGPTVSGPAIAPRPPGVLGAPAAPSTHPAVPGKMSSSTPVSDVSSQRGFTPANIPGIPPKPPGIPPGIPNVAMRVPNVGIPGLVAAATPTVVQTPTPVTPTVTAGLMVGPDDGVIGPVLPGAAMVATQGQKEHDKRHLRTIAGKVWEDKTLEEWPENDYRIFVGNLGNEVTEAILMRTFSHYPSFAMARVVRVKDKPLGYGFVSFMNPLEMARALREMNGKYCGSRQMMLKRVDKSKREFQGKYPPKKKFKKE